MEHRIGVLSDSHVPQFQGLPDSLWQHFAQVEMILHAGDLSLLSVIAELETIAPVVAVQGNVERQEVVSTLPIKRVLQIGGIRIGLVHILGEPERYARTARQEFPDARVVVFGHSHVPYNQEHDGQLLFNPGSVNDRRRQPYCTIGFLSIDDETLQVRAEIVPV